jgi:ADP-ribose pyrophosphatase YjhB (NUDIX family)
LTYCPDCGEPIARPPVGNLMTCRACGARHFLNAKPCAGTLIVRDGRVLLARRAGEPRRGTWDVVGGFLEPHEHPSEGAIREAREETGLDVTLGDLVGIFIDTYGDEGLYTFNVYYLAEAPEGEPIPASDVTELRWFALDEIPDDLAFPHEHELLAQLRLQLDEEMT